jgi:hypothetical protein
MFNSIETAGGATDPPCPIQSPPKSIRAQWAGSPFSSERAALSPFGGAGFARRHFFVEISSVPSFVGRATK